MFRNRLRAATVILAAAALYACGDQDRPTAPEGEAPLPTSIIVDASTGGNDGVLFLPPLRPLGPRNGVFDPTIPLRIEITHQGSATVEQYSVAAGDIAVTDDHYALLWTAPATAVAGAVYEVRAWALSFELGRVDIVVAGSGRDYVELKQGDENATIRNSSRTLPIHVWLNTEALAPTEEQLEQECTSGGGVIDCDVEVIPNSTGGSVTVFDESDPDAPLAGELTVDPGDVVDQDGVPVEAYVLTLLHLDQPATQSTTVPADQQFPFVLRATLTDGEGTPLQFATGASLVLCQPADLETNQAAPYYLPSALAMLQQIIKVDNGTTTFLPTTYGAPECEGSQPPVQIGLESFGSMDGLGRLARLGLRKLKHFVVAEPLRAGHGGLTTTKSILDLSEFAGALPTDPSASTATVPDGTAGQPTEIAIQAKVSGPSTVFDQVDGGDAVAVEVTGANSATLTVGNGGVIDHGDGTYTATYTPVNAGTDAVAITIVDPTTGQPEAIAGSPFSSQVLGAVAVAVRDGTGAPIPGATATLTGPTTLASVTNANGDALFLGLPVGSYTLVVTNVGYGGFSQPVAVGTPGFVPVTAVIGSCPTPGQQTIGVIEPQSPAAAVGAQSQIQIQCSTLVEFVNQRFEPVDVYWIDFNGARVLYNTLQPGTSYLQQTWPEHPWIVVGQVSGDLAYFEPLPADQAPAAAIVAGSAFWWNPANGGNGHFYDYVPAPAISWTDAMNAAAARTHLGLPGHLVTITSGSEQAFLDGMVPMLGLTVWRPWIGLRDVAQNGSFQWITGEALSFTNWDVGEPNNPTFEYWVEMFTNGAWNNNQQNDPVYPTSGYLVEHEPVP